MTAQARRPRGHPSPPRPVTVLPVVPAGPAPGAGYQSAWCGLTGAHARCRGTYAGTPCACPCHRSCPLCGQPLPEVSRG